VKTTFPLKVALSWLIKGRSELVDLCGFLLTPLVDVREVACGFRLDQNRQVWQFCTLRLDYDIDGDPHGPGVGPRRRNEDIQTKSKGAWCHLCHWSARRMFHLAIPASGKVLLDQRELALLLRVPHDRVRPCAAKPVSNNRR